MFEDKECLCEEEDDVQVDAPEVVATVTLCIARMYVSQQQSVIHQ